MRLLTAIFISLSIFGCAAELAHGDEDAGQLYTAIEVLDEDGDVITTRVDATSDSEWIYMDLETNAEVDSDEPNWDVAFQRFSIMLNGGASGEGDVEVAVLEARFDDVDTAPDADFITDQEDSDDDNDDPDLAFSSGETGWYSYNVANHTLSPRAFTYVIRSVEANYFKLAVLDYYDDAGTSGFLTFEWSRLD
jgi:hypothetical protein